MLFRSWDRIAEDHGSAALDTLLRRIDRIIVAMLGAAGRAMQRLPGNHSAYGGNFESMLTARSAQCPTGKMGDAWDVAYAALYLASDEAKYVTGAQLVVDGGLSCKVV